MKQKCYVCKLIQYGFFCCSHITVGGVSKNEFFEFMKPRNFFGTINSIHLVAVELYNKRIQCSLPVFRSYYFTYSLEASDCTPTHATICLCLLKRKFFVDISTFHMLKFNCLFGSLKLFKPK